MILKRTKSDKNNKQILELTLEQLGGDSIARVYAATMLLCERNDCSINTE